MTGGLRKYHTKSRNGCSQCKKRRKKCDMRMPRCGNCLKWGAVCDFTAWAAAVVPVYQKAFAQPIPADGALAYPVPLPTFGAEDVDLLRHYATQSSLTLSPRDTLSLFQVNLPGEAKSHIYLMHSVLAFSALHLSFVDSRNRIKHSYVASKQHQKALVAFRDSVKDVNPENGGAITAFSFLTVVYTLALPVVFGFETVPNPLSTFLEVLQVLRQAWSAIGSALPGVENGKLRELIKPQPSRRRPCVMHAKAAKVVRSLRNFLETSPTVEEENKQVYREGLAHWEHFVMNSPCKPPLWANALVWPMTVPYPFFKLMLEKKPYAMVLLANWAIALYRAPNTWFNPWGKEITADIWRLFPDEETRQALMWPAEVVGVVEKRFHTDGCVCWDCREGDPYLKVRDAAAAVLVERTKYDDDHAVGGTIPVAPVVQDIQPDWSAISNRA